MKSKSFSYKQQPMYILVLLFFIGIVETVQAQNLNEDHVIELASVFGSHMVLQQNAPIHIWGKAAVGTKIFGKLGNEKGEVQTDANGDWLLSFTSRKASFKPIQLEVNTLIVKDILIGEVWLCSGQSNMAFALKKSDAYTLDNKEFSNKNLRFFHEKSLRLVAKKGYTEKELARCNTNDFFQAEWEVSTQKSAAQKSAIASVFGNDIQKELEVPVGIIQVAVGGSSMLNWISPTTLKSNASTASLFKTDWLLNEEIKLAHRKRAKEAFQHVLVPGEPYIIGEFPYRWLCEPSFLFEAGIAPFQQLSFKGVLWYQGESDTDSLESVEKAKELFPLLIQDWRNFFKKQDLPFVFIQLPTYKGALWPDFREVQRITSDNMEHTSMVVTFDHGDEMNIHPKDKQEISERAVQMALKNVYGFEKIIGFPKFKKSKVYKKKIKLSFANYGVGLSSKFDTISGFEVADKNGMFKKVKAVITSKNTIEIQGVFKKASQLRYGYISAPKRSVFVYNSEQLPLGPFIIDLNQ